eukprot:m.205668 g.205668  ORF g.205668 m.205668 type:complete len:88 (+) comp16898_c11_seq1:54-317(+)
MLSITPHRSPERQLESAQQRAQMWAECRGKPVRFSLVDGKQVSAVFLAANFEETEFLVRDLQTSLGLLPAARIRGCDIRRIDVHVDN